jgi:hypothetical protein
MDSEKIICVVQVEKSKLRELLRLGDYACMEAIAREFEASQKNFWVEVQKMKYQEGLQPMEFPN